MLPDELEFNTVIVSQGLPYFKPISDKIPGFCIDLCMRVSLRRSPALSSPPHSPEHAHAPPADLV